MRNIKLRPALKILFYIFAPLAFLTIIYAGFVLSCEYDIYKKDNELVKKCTSDQCKQQQYVAINECRPLGPNIDGAWVNDKVDENNKIYTWMIK